MYKQARLNFASDYEFTWPDLEDCRYVAIDVETNGLNPYSGYKIFACSIATKHGSWYLPFRAQEGFNYKESDVLNLIKTIAEDKQRICLFYNAPFDLAFLRQENIEFPNKIADVMVLAHVCNNNYVQIGLKELSRTLGFETEEETALKQYRRKHKILDYSQIPTDIMAKYAAADAKLTYELFKVLYPRLDEKGKKLFDNECDVTKALLEMQSIGIRINVDYLYELNELYLAQINAIERELTQHGIVPTENRTIINYITKHNIPYKKVTPTGLISTDEKALELINDEVLNKVLEYRNIRKLFSTYVVNLLNNNINGVVRFDYRQTGTVTGRFSGNSQQFPRKMDVIRKAFIPREGYAFLISDYSGQEVRLAAHYSNDKNIIAAYKADNNFDFHGMVAKQLNIERQMAKQLVFAIIYGAGKERLSLNLNVDLTKAKEILDNFYAEFPAIARLQRKVDKEIQERGYITNIYGRKLYISSDMSYKGINYLIQSSGADMMKHAFVKINNTKPDYLHILWSIHDELGFECPVDKVGECAKFIKENMEDLSTFTIPMVVEINYSLTNWAEKQLLNV